MHTYVLHHDDQSYGNCHVFESYTAGSYLGHLEVETLNSYPQWVVEELNLPAAGPGLPVLVFDVIQAHSPELAFPLFEAAHHRWPDHFIVSGLKLTTEEVALLERYLTETGHAGFTKDRSI